MRLTSNYVLGLLIAAMVFLLAGPLPGQTIQGRAQVTAVMGSATFSAPGGAPMRLREGTILQEGYVVQTAHGSALDLALGGDSGTLRLTQNTTLSLDRLAVSDSDFQVEIQLTLSEGTVVGFGNDLGLTSKYQIKISNGIVAVGARQFRINAKGFLVDLDGTLIFAHVGMDGNLTSHTLRAPPPVYFSPIEGIRPVPEKLLREVVNQAKPKLPAF